MPIVAFIDQFVLPRERGEQKDKEMALRVLFEGSLLVGHGGVGGRVAADTAACSQVEVPGRTLIRRVWLVRGGAEVMVCVVYDRLDTDNERNTTASAALHSLSSTVWGCE